MKKFYASKMVMIVVALVALVAVGCTRGSGKGGAEGKKQEVKVSIGVPESHFEYKAMVEFEKYVESNIPTMDVVIYPANSLAVDKSALEFIQLGTVQMNLPSPEVLGNFQKSFNLLSLPFLFDDQETADAVVHGEWGKTLLATLKGTGFVGLGFGNFGFRQLTNSVKPVRTPEDLSGLKIRTMQNPVHLAYFRALGANPTPMDFSEVFSALSQGIIDGQENPLKNIESFKLYEIQPYVTMTGHVYSWVVFVLGETFFNALSEKEQGIFRDATQVAIDFMKKAVAEEDREARKVMEQYGTKFIDLTSEEKDAFRKAGAEIIDAAGMEADAALYGTLKEAIAAYKKQ